MALTPTTELEAINILLSTIGESPVNSLESVAGVVDAAVARSVLKEVSIQTQEPGWQFNTEEGFKLIPDLANGEINVPGNCIQCIASGQSANINIAVRGTRLYNRTTHTYTFTSPVVVNMVLLLDFDELPQSVRHYVVVRSARVFQARQLGSPLLDSFTERDEQLALVAVNRLEAQTGGHNMLTGSSAVSRILNR